MSCCVCIFFFFSSRRRHTRLQGDWSSDVCSSDLVFEHEAWRAERVVWKSFAPAVLLSLITENPGLRPGLQSGRRSAALDRKSTRLNSSHLVISYAVFCLKKKKHNQSSSVLIAVLR